MYLRTVKSVLVCVEYVSANALSVWCGCGHLWGSECRLRVSSESQCVCCRLVVALFGDELHLVVLRLTCAQALERLSILVGLYTLALTRSSSQLIT